MVSLNVLGMNCGTSIDGIDVALCKITSQPSSPDITVELLSYNEVPVTPSLRSRILQLVKPSATTTLEDVCDLNFALGEEFARAVKYTGVDTKDVDVIASHGQTQLHTTIGERISTLQMAEPAVIANKTKKYVQYTKQTIH
jgi:1,6-anhydro-N-acetylmuramate kinase